VHHVRSARASNGTWHHSVWGPSLLDGVRGRGSITNLGERKKENMLQGGGEGGEKSEKSSKEGELKIVPSDFFFELRMTGRFGTAQVLHACDSAPCRQPRIHGSRPGNLSLCCLCSSSPTCCLLLRRSRRASDQ
jgi:hypothetical protein